MSDLISRQAAIDALDCINGTEEVLRSLPSAQPERTCVNCGRTVNNGGWYADGRTRCPIEEHYALPKDGFCHLWEKRNVTDDDYPRRTDKQTPLRRKEEGKAEGRRMMGIVFAVLCFVCAIGILFYGLSRANEFNYREAERKDGEADG